MTTKFHELHGEVLSAMVLHLLHQHPDLAKLFTGNPDEPLDQDRVLSTLQAHNQRMADSLHTGQFAAPQQPAQPAQGGMSRDAARVANVRALLNAKG
jgi:hypothetical protein